MRKGTASRRTIACGLLCVLTAARVMGQDAPPPEVAPPFEPPPLQPSLLDVLTGHPIAVEMKKAKMDPLQVPPFAGAPVDSPKGLAAKIKAAELDVPNRIEAIQYLGTVDCVAFPEAREMLVAAMLEDEFEPVRYEAVMALGMMLSRGVNLEAGENCCQCDACKDRREERKEFVEEVEEHSKKAQCKHPKNPCELVHQTIPKLLHAPFVAMKNCCERIQYGPAEERRYDFCRGCCDEETLTALAKVAFERDDFGCPIEPSARVREAAAQVLTICPCKPVPGFATDLPEVLPVPEEGGEEVVPLPDGEDRPEPPPATEEAETRAAPPAPLPAGSAAASPEASVAPASYSDPTRRFVGQPIEVLSRHCIVGLKNHEFVEVDGDHSTTYKGRVYYFADADAKAEFLENPEEYAPAYCGIDPVLFLETKRVEEGRFLREHDGRFYLFTSKANWERFRADPEAYVAN